MSFVTSFKYRTRAGYYRLRELIAPSVIREGRQVPIIINNFNRLTTLARLIERLEGCGYTNIYIIDNLSTYPPLLEYYDKCPYKVFRLDRNLGFKALWKSGLNKQLGQDYFIYTDSDVVPVEACPSDFIDHLLAIIKRYPYAHKVGLSLRIDDLPDHFDKKEQVIEWESRYFLRKNKEGLFKAAVDTTFAIYRPRVCLGRHRYVEAYRTPYPYQLYHLPWYVDSAALSEEESYYKAHCNASSTWCK